MKTQTDMMSYLGGIPVAMSYGDVYSLTCTTGIIDGTENNETALTTGKHGEVCKVYSVDQHAMIPDVLIMSEKVLEGRSPRKIRRSFWKLPTTPPRPIRSCGIRPLKKL